MKEKKLKVLMPTSLPAFYFLDILLLYREKFSLWNSQAWLERQVLIALLGIELGPSRQERKSVWQITNMAPILSV